MLIPFRWWNLEWDVECNVNVENEFVHPPSLMSLSTLMIPSLRCERSRGMVEHGNAHTQALRGTDISYTRGAKSLRRQLVSMRQNHNDYNAVASANNSQGESVSHIEPDRFSCDDAVQTHIHLPTLGCGMAYMYSAGPDPARRGR